MDINGEQMRIYFCGSITAGREDVHYYRDLIAFMKHSGHVLTEHIGDPALTHLGEDMTAKDINRRDLEWLALAHAAVAEVTRPSTGVGIELGRLAERQVPILCLYRPQEGKRVSGLIEGADDMVVRPYNSLKVANTYVSRFLSAVRDGSDWHNI